MGTEAQAKSSPTVAPAISHAPANLLQRKCACGGEHGVSGECEDCRKKRLGVVQRLALDKSPASSVPPIVHEVLRSPGQPLDMETRSFIEPRFGHDFSQVRVHVDSKAVESARAVNAAAYTVGNDIVLPGKAESVAGSRLLAHELTHVIQQAGSGTSAASTSRSNQELESEAERAADAITAGNYFQPSLQTGLAVHRQGGPPPPADLSGLTATRDAFNNTGAPDANNCAVILPAALGVDGPRLGQNGMELIFRINGAIPSGTEFEITRTRASGLWQEDGGAWARLGGNPAGTNDDHHDDDECQTPVGGRIFVIDTPGLGGSLNPRGVEFLGAGTVSATATSAVWKLAFAEWVIARNRRLGISWQRISTPNFHRWHSIFSTSLVGGTWTRVDTPSGQQNEIEMGNISTTGPTP